MSVKDPYICNLSVKKCTAITEVDKYWHAISQIKDCLETGSKCPMDRRAHSKPMELLRVQHPTLPPLPLQPANFSLSSASSPFSYIYRRHLDPFLQCNDLFFYSVYSQSNAVVCKYNIFVLVSNCFCFFF